MAVKMSVSKIALAGVFASLGLAAPAFAAEEPYPMVPAPSSAATTAAVDGPAQAQSPAITWDFNYIGEYAANPSGGIRHDDAYSGQVYLGATVDLERQFGIKGGSLLVAMTNRHGDSLSDTAIGNGTSVQEIHGLQNTYLAQLVYTQKFADGRAKLEVGRMPSAAYTLSDGIYCNFQSNAICGNPVVVYKNANLSGFPVSVWGAKLGVNLTDKVNLQVGVHEVNPYQNNLKRHGFDWSTSNATGVIVPIELGYKTSFANDSMPRNYQIGIWFDRSPYTDPVFDAAGGPAVVSGNPYRREYGRSSAWVRFEQMVWRPDPTSEGGLKVFGIFLQGVSGRNTQDNYYTLGLLQTGTFRGRDKDTIGFAFTDQVFSDAAVDNIRAARALVGASTDIPRHEQMWELNYGFQVSDGIRVMPNLQYIVNPDQQSDPFRTKDIPDAFVIGVKFSIDFIKASSMFGG